MSRIYITPLFATLILLNTACAQQTPNNKVSDNPFGIQQIDRTPAEWKEQLSDMEYYVLREQGTERAFTGDLWDNKEEGIYTCAGCGLPVFESTTKFRSGTGWPSFYQPIKEENVATEEDRAYGMLRTEVHCARCGGHLGHIFPDGPEPTGLRYCINSISMDFVPKSIEKSQN